MRLLLCTVAAGLLLAAAYFHAWNRSSFRDFEGAQLTAFQRELAQLEASASLSGEEQVTVQLIEDERRRRRWILPLLAGGVLCALGAVFAPRRARGHTDEDLRLVSAVGRPDALQAQARREAAGLLGVALKAPPAVVEAALKAQLAAGDASQAEAMPPELRRLVDERRRALVKARDLLLGEAPSRAGEAG